MLQKKCFSRIGNAFFLPKSNSFLFVELDVETVRADSHGLCTQLGQTLECHALEILDVARGTCTF